MPIEFQCSTCQTTLRTGDETAGKSARCPSCGGIVPIPMSTQGVSNPGSQDPAPDQNPYSVRPAQQNASGFSTPAYPGYQAPTRQQIQSRILGPAIGILVFNSLAGMFCLVAGLGGVMSLADGDSPGEDIVVLIIVAICLVMLLVGIVAAVQMLRMRSHTLSVIGVICTAVVGLPCCMIPTGFGIWGLVVLLDANAKQYFR